MNLEQTLQYISEADEDTLFILWTNADPVTAELMVFMYAENCMKYKKWKQVSIIIWGATTKLVMDNPQIRQKIEHLQEMGIHFTACVTCAEELGGKEVLEKMGIDLIKWLEPLTQLIRSGKKLITI